MKNEKNADFYVLDGIDFVKISGKFCHIENSRFISYKFLDAKEQCLNDKQCRSILRQDWDGLSCDEAETIGTYYNIDRAIYYMCYVGYSFKDSQTKCVYEKIGNLFLFLDFRSAILKI